VKEKIEELRHLLNVEPDRDIIRACLTELEEMVGGRKRCSIEGCKKIGIHVVCDAHRKGTP